MARTRSRRHWRTQLTGNAAIRKLTGFGASTQAVTRVQTFGSHESAQEILAQVGTRGVIPRGGGRAYGDAAINSGGTTAIARIQTSIRINQANNTFTAPAGARLDEVLAQIIPRGYFLPVTPGTARATIGGAIAADVHGKNHHRDGSLGAHVLSIKMTTPQGNALTLAPDDVRFQATVGGMGLTGFIQEATIRGLPIETSFMKVRTVRTSDLAATVEALRELDKVHRYSVAWLDLLARGPALGRGVVIAGDHAAVGEIPDGNRHRDPLAYRPARALGVPVRPPLNLLTRGGVALFNYAYYAANGRRNTTSISDIPSFFHPLDAIRGWNRLYGPKGFIQYQFVVPDDGDGVKALVASIQAIATSGYPGFLTVLKRFGPEGDALISFPREGWTLTVDLPCGSGLHALVTNLDGIVLRGGGRVYLAKDATASSSHLEVMYPRLAEWATIRREMDPLGIMQSDLSRRLGLASGRPANRKSG